MSNEEEKELTFEQIDQWVQEKYCLFCQARAHMVKMSQLEQKYQKKMERVFDQMLTIEPSVIDTPEKIEQLTATLNTIVKAGGRVIVIVGT